MKKKLIVLAVSALMLFAAYAPSQAACNNHYLAKVSQVAATCTTDGRIEYRCMNCGQGSVKTIKATGHNWVPATRTRPKTCTRCNAMSGAPLGH